MYIEASNIMWHRCLLLILTSFCQFYQDVKVQYNQYNFQGSPDLWAAPRTWYRASSLPRKDTKFPLCQEMELSQRFYLDLDSINSKAQPLGPETWVPEPMLQERSFSPGVYSGVIWKVIFIEVGIPLPCSQVFA